MFRIDTATAAATLPAPGAAGTPGYFTNGNPGTGVPPTTISADWLNLLQEEIMSVLGAASIAESKTATNQLLTALQTLFAPLSGFTASLAGNGYQKFSSGLILQWKTVTGVIATGGSSSFPIAFPNNAFIVLPSYDFGSSGSNFILSAVAASLSNFSYTWQSIFATYGSGSSVPVKIIAIGN